MPSKSAGMPRAGSSIPLTPVPVWKQSEHRPPTPPTRIIVASRVGSLSWLPLEPGPIGSPFTSSGPTCEQKRPSPIHGCVTGVQTPLVPPCDREKCGSTPDVPVSPAIVCWALQESSEGLETNVRTPSACWMRAA